MRLLVTGGAGFIGSNYVRMIASGEIEGVSEVTVLDKLTYSGNKENLEGISRSDFEFVEGDICDVDLVHHVTRNIDAILNFAAESHVDRSIDSSREFYLTNVVGTQTLLEAARKNEVQTFLQVSTDEVYGSITKGSWDEEFALQPNSPYAASKASADLLVRSYVKTYGMDVRITRSSNNYGPYQFPEKLIPLMITHAIEGKDLPIYGDGKNIRDWLYVKDHCHALRLVLEQGQIGEVYNIGGLAEKSNLEVVGSLCEILDRLHPRSDGTSYTSQISFVRDRPGHDRRYAMDISKIKREFGWLPKEDFQSGLLKTVRWYLDNRQWVGQLQARRGFA